MKETNKLSVTVDAVEIDAKSITEAQRNLSRKNKKLELSFFQENFLEFDAGSEYDFVIGNPPYIGKKLLEKENLENCRRIHIEGGLGDKHIRNIWTAFLVKSALLLKPDGMLAFVLPGELLQVSFAKSIRHFLEDEYKNIEILTFEELVFPGIGQDVVVLFAHGKDSVSGINFARVKNLESLNQPVNFVSKNFNRKTSVEKWSNYLLEIDDLEFLFEMADKVGKISDCCTSSPGIVTGANNFFIVNDKTRKQYELEPYCKPIIQKGLFVDKTVCFDRQSFDELLNSDLPCFFLDFKDTDEDSLPPLPRKYLKKGTDLEIHNRYKCSRRKPWYNVPPVRKADGFFFKRCHLYPKVLKNEEKVIVTDSAYYIRPNDGFDINSIVCSFYNSLTLTFCELTGRFYGGGVLELTPLEFRGLPLPYRPIASDEFIKFNNDFKKCESIEQILNKYGEDVLGCHEIGKADRERLEKIRLKLVSRRLK